jgi:hypothetical protein
LQPNVPICSLLARCKQHLYLKHGEIVGRKLINLARKNARCTMLSPIGSPHNTAITLYNGHNIVQFVKHCTMFVFSANRVKFGGKFASHMGQHPIGPWCFRAHIWPIPSPN